MREFELVGELSGFKDCPHAVRKWRIQWRAPQKLSEPYLVMVRSGN